MKVKWKCPNCGKKHKWDWIPSACRVGPISMPSCFSCDIKSEMYMRKRKKKKGYKCVPLRAGSTCVCRCDLCW